MSTNVSNEKFPPEENEFMEIHYHKTPSGGDLSISYFYDKEKRPCRKENMAYMDIVEYKKDGTYLNCHYGNYGKDF